MTFDVVFKEERRQQLTTAVADGKFYYNGVPRVVEVTDATVTAVATDGVPTGLVRVTGTARVSTRFDPWTIFDSQTPEDDWPCDEEHTFWSRWFPRWFRPRRVAWIWAPQQYLPFDAVVPVTDIHVCFPQSEA